jgi:hypothetical protein
VSLFFITPLLSPPLSFIPKSWYYGKGILLYHAGGENLKGKKGTKEKVCGQKEKAG